MKFEEALERLYQRVNYERTPGFVRDLEPFRRWLAHLGNPQHAFRAILVAGTKGKGSTAVHLARALQNAGFKTGLYLSPHLVDIRERIQINGAWIPEDAFGRLMDRLVPYLESRSGGFRTFFETLTALAFLYFQEEQVDYAVLEVGLGGRLDATNTVEPVATVFTPISFDHTHILGTTLEAIAREKAGILRGRPVAASAPQEPEVLRVLRERAHAAGVPLRVLHRRSIKVLEAGLEGSRFELLVGEGEPLQLFTPLCGKFQVENAALAALTLQALGIDSISFEGLRFPGRCQIVDTQPYTVLDCAHNPFSLRALLDAVQELLEFDQMVPVFAASRDKDIQSMLDILSRWSQVFVLTQFSNPRAASPWDMAELLRETPGVQVKVVQDPVKALNLARRLAGPRGLVLATGSAYLVGDLLQRLAL